PARHGQTQEEVVARRQVAERLQYLVALAGPRFEQVREELSAEQQRRSGVTAVQLVAHVDRAAHDRLERYPASALHCGADRRGDRVLDGARRAAPAAVVRAVVQPVA